MKLINADNLVRTVGYYRLRNGEDIQIRYVAIEQIDSAPTVKAIPIEWIKKWCNEEHNRKSLEERLLKRYGVITMLEDWQKENQSLE